MLRCQHHAYGFRILTSKYAYGFLKKILLLLRSILSGQRREGNQFHDSIFIVISNSFGKVKGRKEPEPYGPTFVKGTLKFPCTWCGPILRTMRLGNLSCPFHFKPERGLATPGLSQPEMNITLDVDFGKSKSSGIYSAMRNQPNRTSGHRKHEQLLFKCECVQKHNTVYA